MKLCTICGDEDANTITTPCGHNFHRTCIQQVVRPKCPMCQADLTAFLVKQCGVTTQTLAIRKQEDDDRILHDSLYSCPVEDLSIEEAVFMVKQEMKNDFKNWFFVFRDVLFDRIFDARDYFLQISLSRKGRGVFTFWFDESELTLFVANPKHRSTAVWLTPGKIRKSNKDLATFAQHVVRHVQEDTSTNFGVLLIVTVNGDSAVSQRVFSVDSDRVQRFISETQGGGYISGISPMRVSYRDLLCSLTKGHTCRSCGHSPREHNPEYVWARKVWKRIQRRKRLENVTK